MSSSAVATPRMGLPPAVVEQAGRLVAGSGGRARLAGHEPLKKSVHRLRFEAAGGRTSVVVKRLSPRRARANLLVAERWLPAAGLEQACPGLLGVVRDAAARWHVYEDVPGSGLDESGPDPERVGPVVELIVELHTRFAGHPLLAECRELAEELGIGFYSVKVARSVGLLESIRAEGPQQALRDRLLRRLERLHRERDERAALLETFGGAETLLHGDLWTTNTLVGAGSNGLEAWLIDWDHVGVGPLTYDLSTFLYRFPSAVRPWILGLYREAAAHRGGSLPDDPTLNALFETAEYARYACCLADAALAASEGKHWGFEQMAEIERWFSKLERARLVDGGR
jgi:Phosphotransferase enzyme family